MRPRPTEIDPSPSANEPVDEDAMRVRLAARRRVFTLQFDARYGAGADALDALVRQVERIDPSFRH